MAITKKSEEQKHLQESKTSLHCLSLLLASRWHGFQEATDLRYVGSGTPSTLAETGLTALVKAMPVPYLYSVVEILQDDFAVPASRGCSKEFNAQLTCSTPSQRPYRCARLKLDLVGQ